MSHPKGYNRIVHDTDYSTFKAKTWFYQRKRDGVIVIEQTKEGGESQTIYLYESDLDLIKDIKELV